MICYSKSAIGPAPEAVTKKSEVEQEGGGGRARRLWEGGGGGLGTS